MLKIKKYIQLIMFLFLTAIILSSCFGCSSDKSKIEFTIGVMQYSEAESLSDCYKGFIDGLAEAGYKNEVNIKIAYKTAAGDASTAATIANYLVNYNCDLICSLTTVNSLAIKQKTDKIPVVMCAVTEPEYSGLVQSNEHPGGNLTGMSDLSPIFGQVELLQKLVQDVNVVGILYCSSETNALPQADKFMKALEEAGINYINSPISQIDELKLTIDTLSNKVDALYVAPDNIMVASANLVSNTAIDAGLPIISSYGLVHGGALASFGVDYYELGKSTAEMALRILVDGENPGDIPIGYQAKETMRAVINEKTANALGLNIPDEIMKTAIILK